jgi:hypothetical protein
VAGNLDREPGVRNPTFDQQEFDEDVERRENRVQRDVSRTSVVKFDTGAGGGDDEDDDREDGDAEGKETNFVRHNTPHPRELKTKAAKLLAKKGEQVKAVGAKDKNAEERAAETSTLVDPSGEEDESSVVEESDAVERDREERESEKVQVVQSADPPVLVMNGDAHLWVPQPPEMTRQDSVDAEEEEEKQPLMNESTVGDDAEADDGKVSRGGHFF